MREVTLRGGQLVAAVVHTVTSLPAPMTCAAGPVVDVVVVVMGQCHLGGGMEVVVRRRDDEC